MWLIALACAPPELERPLPAPAEPLVLPLQLESPLPCAPGCEREDRVRSAVLAGLGELERAAADDAVDLNLDLLIALPSISQVFRSHRLEALQASLGPRLDSGGDPRRRFWDPGARMPEDWTSAWQPDPQQKVSPNHLLVEALYCGEHGFRAETVAYACEVYRDQGGVYSAHAAWGLSLAVDRGCVDRASTCLDAVRDELVSAALAARPLTATLDRDLLAEQVLFGLMAGASRDSLVGPVDRLLEAQAVGGSMAVATADENPWWGVHATLAAMWAWASWLEAP